MGSRVCVDDGRSCFSIQCFKCLMRVIPQAQPRDARSRDRPCAANHVLRMRTRAHVGLHFRLSRSSASSLSNEHLSLELSLSRARRCIAPVAAEVANDRQLECHEAPPCSCRHKYMRLGSSQFEVFNSGRQVYSIAFEQTHRNALGSPRNATAVVSCVIAPR
jgi:hypothetical protein